MPASMGQRSRPSARRTWIERGGARIAVYHVEPASDVARRCRVLLVHENRGLVPYMWDVVAELTDAGHPVVVPDLLSRLGGTERFAAHPDAVTTREIAGDVHVADLVTVFDAVTDPDPPAVFGLCFGAEMAWRLLTERNPRCAVLYYGVGPDPAAVPRIGCQVFAVYAQDDPRVNDTLPPLLDALSAGEVAYRIESFPGTRHAFHDHHRPDRHHPAAAARVWEETLAFLAGEACGAIRSPAQEG